MSVKNLDSSACLFCKKCAVHVPAWSLIPIHSLVSWYLIGYSWTDASGSRRATLDAFLVRDKQSLGSITCIESSDPRLDHLGLQAAIVDDRLRPMPDLESLLRPVRLKLEGLRDVGTRSEHTRLAEEAVIRVQASRSTATKIFPYLDEMKSAVLAAAKATLGMRGGEIRQSIPLHSDW